MLWKENWQVLSKNASEKLKEFKSVELTKIFKVP